MPRIARVIASGYPHHITQRGNNRDTVFFDDEDRQTYLKLLSIYKEKYHFEIWSYCLMDNHIHLLAVPETQFSLARGIGLINQVYTQYLNRKLKRSGHVWQNRFFSCVVENNQYLWSVVRYIIRNPLKAGLVEKAEAYQWSSAKTHIYGLNDPILCSNVWISSREQSAFADFLNSVDEEADNAIRRATRSGLPFGSEDFVDMLEFGLEQSLRPPRRGRPRKNSECP